MRSVILIIMVMILGALVFAGFEMLINLSIPLTILIMGLVFLLVFVIEEIVRRKKKTNGDDNETCSSWTCNECGTDNPNSIRKCKNCNASKP